MMDPLPQYIDPIRLAIKFKRLSGQMSLGEMERLTSLLASTQGQVDIDLELGIDRSKIRNIRGRIRANVTLVCQRCLQTMDYMIDSKVMLGIIIEREQADQLPAKYEPLLIESDKVSLKDIIEDEMILAIPSTPHHDLSNDKEVCESTIKYFHNDSKGSVDGNKRENPFAVLADLKRKN